MPHDSKSDLPLDIIQFLYLVAGTSNNGWEDSPGSVITGETGFAHAGAIVNDKSSSIFVTHVGFWTLSEIEYLHPEVV